MLINFIRTPSFQLSLQYGLTTITKAAVVSFMLAAAHGAHAVDSMSAEFATGNKTDMVRVGAQWKWKQKWWQSNGTHIGGYWDLTLAHWRGNQFRNRPGATQAMTDVGIAPVLRLQKDSLAGPYAEVGIGIHYLSDHYDNNERQLSTRFQFGDHLGIGYVFQSEVDLSLRIQHFSNGSIKQPNDGVNFAVVRIGYSFD